MEYLQQFGVPGLFVASFLAATILPLSSELMLAALVLGGLPPAMLIAVALGGNVLGSVVNYFLGLGGGTLFRRRIRTKEQPEVRASIEKITRWGTVSLLFAWVPVVGDPLTVAAGVLRVNFVHFLCLVTVGKLARYVVVVWLMLAG